MSARDNILDKIVRNMLQRGFPNTVRSGVTVLVTKTGGNVLVVSYTDKAVQSPMGGVSPLTSPYLGIGIAAPGSLKLKGAAGENTIAAIVTTVEALALLKELDGFANDLVVEAGDTTTQLARITGTADMLGMGQ